MTKQEYLLAAAKAAEKNGDFDVADDLTIEATNARTQQFQDAAANLWESGNWDLY